MKRPKSYDDSDEDYEDGLSTPSRDIFDTCPLKRKDPWEDEFMAKLGKSEITSCRPQELLTSFENGQILLNPKHRQSTGHSCEGRCIYYKANYAIRSDEWQPIKGTKFLCDVVEVQCKAGDGKIDYKYLHTQIYEYSRDRLKEFGDLGRPTNARHITENTLHPDVYIIILDAMSVTGGFRQMPATMVFLEEALQAVPFYHVAKVAENSKPNSIAFLFGEIPIPVDRRVFGVRDVLPYTLDENESCGRPLDNETYVMFEYEDAGYKTMWACDYYLGNFAYTNCKGLQKQLATHYMRPFQIRGAYQTDRLLKDAIFDHDKCRYPYVHLLDYQKKFIDAYPGTPKMSLMWSVAASHDSERPMANTDHDFRRFFEENKHKFDNAVTIVMGDHGPRYDSAVNTKQGLYDKNNPLMLVSLPKALRETNMQKVLKRNSEFLSSHHDLHATLVDIIRHQPSSNFSDTSYLRINGTYGSSWLRRFETGVPRTCRTLPIPSQYCLCDYGQEEITDGSLKKKLGELAVSDVNKHLRERGVDGLCEEVKLEEVGKLLSIPSKSYKARYRVHFTTKNEAKLITTYVELENGNLQLLEKEWDRVNKYGSTADCLQSDAKNFDLRILCYCKKRAI
ncbi:unnamed protein product, partial [Mesorhabditis spiculigera]